MLSYDELLQKYNLLEQENKVLKARIAELKKEKHKQVIITESTIAALPDSQVTMRSTPEEKIKLFRSFFCGREDVFARRWYSTTTISNDFSEFVNVIKANIRYNQIDKREFEKIIWRGTSESIMYFSFKYST